MAETTLDDVNATLIELGQLLTAIYIQQSRTLDFVATQFRIEHGQQKYELIRDSHAAGELVYVAPALSEEDDHEETEQETSPDA